MNKYEITIITKENLPAGGPVEKEINELGGKILSVNSLGQKQFVYPVKKETAGFYTVVNFEIEPTKVLELNQKLGLKPEILRHIILLAKAVKIEKPIKPEGEKVGQRPISPGLKKVEELKPVKKPIKKIEPPKLIPAAPKVMKAAKEIEEEESSTEERLKALDKKLDELLKE